MFRGEEPVLRVKPHSAADLDRTPSQAKPGDVGLDLYVSEARTIGPGDFVDVPCGVSVRLPDGYWALITGRSSTLRRRGLLVANGIIDTGYTGPLFAGVQNLGRQDVHVDAGERLAQLILLPNVADRLVVQVTSELGDTPRGATGFGSTGL